MGFPRGRDRDEAGRGGGKNPPARRRGQGPGERTGVQSSGTPQGGDPRTLRGAGGDRKFAFWIAAIGSGYGNAGLELLLQSAHGRPMTPSDASPVPGFFQRFEMQRVTAPWLDGVLAEDDDRVVALFLWGRDCPSCDIAKRALLASPARFRPPGLRWLHQNVYDDRALATRFALHGVPTWLLFHRGRKLGRITGWPGADAFADALGRQLALAGHAPAGADAGG